jgi:hypothetical protein
MPVLRLIRGSLHGIRDRLRAMPVRHRIAVQRLKMPVRARRAKANRIALTPIIAIGEMANVRLFLTGPVAMTAAALVPATCRKVELWDAVLIVSPMPTVPTKRRAPAA